MNFLIGEAFADAALAVICEAELDVGEIDLIGSHGQTVYHLPPQTGAQYVPSTLQLGESAVIAYRTGIPTIANFRVADLAAGGQGAPLVPYVDFLLFRGVDRTVALQNIGGISNVTLIPAGAVGSDVLASDTGPGNMIIDSVMEILTDGEEKYDNAGQFAAQGSVCESLLGEWLGHPFISAHPPKTTGREAFGRQFADQALEGAQTLNLGPADLVATLTAFTAQSIFDYYRRFLFPHHSVNEIYISGGGSHNLTLMQHLKTLSQPIPLLPIDSIGFSSDAKEAIAFAILANEAVHGNPTNLPQVTGASQPMVLGTFSPA
jgi:anhydro-N-acetylmuramic acid kinase